MERRRIYGPRLQIGAANGNLENVSNSGKDSDAFDVGIVGKSDFLLIINWSGAGTTDNLIITPFVRDLATENWTTVSPTVFSPFGTGTYAKTLTAAATGTHLIYFHDFPFRFGRINFKSAGATDTYDIDAYVRLLTETT